MSDTAQKLLLLGFLFFLHLGTRVGATVTGTKYCNSYMCVTGQHDNTTKTDTYTLQPPSGKSIPLSSFGWMAIGFGTTMADSPMVIVWPNSDGSFTLSQRQASTNAMPTVVSNPPRKATLDTSSSFSNTTSTSITFTLPANTTTTNAALNKTNIIWAYGTTNPGSSSSSATFKQHLASGNTQLALLSNLSASNSTTGSNSTTTSSGSSSDKTTTSSSKNILIAHVACGAIATMFLLPTGIIIPRIARGLTDKRWWFPVHAAINGLLAFGLIAAAFGIARSNFHSNGGFGSSHRKLGLTLFILAIFQTLLGLFTHFFKRSHRFQASSGRGPSNWIHMALGLVVVGIGFGTVWKGIDEEWGTYSGTGNPSIGWKVGWGLVVAITAIVYLGGLYLVPRQRAIERQGRQLDASLAAGRGLYGHYDGNEGKYSNTTPPNDAAYQPQTQYQSDLPPPPPPPGTTGVRPPPPTYALPTTTNGNAGSNNQPLRRLPPPLPPVRSEYEMSRR